MNAKNRLILTLVATLAVGGLVAVNTRAAEENNAPQRPLRGRLMERAKEKLGLTDEQVAQIKAAVKSERNDIKGLLSRLRDARTELRDAIQSPNATEESVRAASAKVAAVEADAAVERMKMHARIDPILTDAQRKELGQMRSRVNKAGKTAGDRVARALGE